MTIVPGDPPPTFDGNDPEWVLYYDDEGVARVGLKSQIDPDSGGGGGGQRVIVADDTDVTVDAFNGTTIVAYTSITTTRTVFIPAPDTDAQIIWVKDLTGSIAPDGSVFITIDGVEDVQWPNSDVTIFNDGTAWQPLNDPSTADSDLSDYVGKKTSTDEFPIMPWTLDHQGTGIWDSTLQYTLGTVVLDPNDNNSYVAKINETHLTTVGAAPNVTGAEWHLIDTVDNQPVILRGVYDPTAFGFIEGNPSGTAHGQVLIIDDYSRGWVNDGDIGNNQWDSVVLFHGTIDPTTGGGQPHTPADPQPCYIQTDGGGSPLQAWQATGPGDTDWAMSPGLSIVSDPFDPVNDTANTGLPAPAGSVYLLKDGSVGTVWWKYSSQQATDWVEINGGGKYRGAYNSATSYLRGDVVSEFDSGLGHSIIYIALVTNIAVDPFDDVSGAPALRSWRLLTYPADAWVVDTTYSQGNVVFASDGNGPPDVYVSLSNSNIGNNPTDDAVNWQPEHFDSILTSPDDFDSHRLYHVGEMVLSDAILYRCSNEAIPGTTPATNPSNWEALVPRSAKFSVSLDTTSPFGSMSESGITQQLDPVGFTGGGAATITVPPFTYPADALMNGPAGINVSGIPDSTDGFDLQIFVQVSNVDGTETIEVGGLTVLDPHTDSGSFDPADFSVQGQVGTDLSFDGSHISSAAGGTYAIIVHFALGYD